MVTEAYANNALTTLAGTGQPWASIPSAGTSEIWQITSSGLPLPQVTTGVSQYRAAIYTTNVGDINPELVIVTNTIDATHIQVTRGAEGSPIKSHAAGDTFAVIVTKGNIISDLSSRAIDNAVMHLAGSEITTGPKQNNGDWSFTSGRPWAEPNNVAEDGSVDATVGIQAAINNSYGAMARLKPGATYRVDGSLIIGIRQHLEIPAGTTVIRKSVAEGGVSNTAPLIILNGNFARLSGNGLIQTDNASPSGIILIGQQTVTRSVYDGVVVSGNPIVTSATANWTTNASVGQSFSIAQANTGATFFNTTILSIDSTNQITLAAAPVLSVNPAALYWGTNGNVLWAEVRTVRLQGIETTGNKGVFFNSPPQGSGTGTYANKIDTVQMQRLGDGVYFGPQANANQVVNAYWYLIQDNAVHAIDSVEFLIEGGFIHNSSNVTCLRFEKCVYGTVRGLMAEPGGGSASAYNLDANCFECSIDITANTAGPVIDLGINNVKINKRDFRGQKVAASLGIVTAMTAGPPTDTNFQVTTPSGSIQSNAEDGQISLDSTNNRLYARLGGTYQFTQLGSGPGALPIVIARKAADDTGRIVTTFSDDDTLIFSIGANEVWAFEFVLRVDGSTTGDFSCKIVGPAGATGSIGSLRLSTAAATSTTSPIQDDVGLNTSISHGTVGVGTPTRCTLRGIIVNSSTSGQVKLQWAQNTVDASNATRVLANSYLRAQKQ